MGSIYFISGKTCILKLAVLAESNRPKIFSWRSFQEGFLFTKATIGNTELERRSFTSYGPAAINPRSPAF